jgi:hypothetical protein
VSGNPNSFTLGELVASTDNVGNGAGDMPGR